MATVYAALGAKLSVVELTGQLMPGADPDLVRPLEKRLKARYEQILLNTKVTGCTAAPEGLAVEFEDANGKRTDVFDRVLVAVGRSANGKRIDLEAADIDVSDRGIIPVDKQMRTNLPHVFAIGDLVPGPMLAHKAMHEAKVAAEVAAGHKSYFDARVIPSVAYTDPEVAWVGLTETDAKKNGTQYKKGQFPWAASGRSLALGRDEGFSKLLFDPVNASRAGRRHGGSECRRAGRRSGAGHRDGRGCGGHRPDDSSAPDAVGDGGAVGRSLRRHHHRPVHAEEGVSPRL